MSVREKNEEGKIKKHFWIGYGVPIDLKDDLISSTRRVNKQ
jgi:hypothetical protein